MNAPEALVPAIHGDAPLFVNIVESLCRWVRQSREVRRFSRPPSRRIVELATRDYPRIRLVRWRT